MKMETHLDEVVFQAIARRWEDRAKDIAFLAKHFWHSFEEWLNWEALLGCRDAGLHNVWPKAPYSHKDQDRSLPKVIRFKDTKEISDIMVDSDSERVVVEVSVVHGTDGKNRARLDHDRMKLNPEGCQAADKKVFPLLLVVSMYHAENPQNASFPRWFTEWVAKSESEMGPAFKHTFKLDECGLFEARGWCVSHR